MHIISCMPHDVGVGRDSFNEYQNYLSCGSLYRNYDFARDRPTGPRMIVGSICACIERGLSRREEIIAAVSKSSRCRTWTVGWVLDEMTSGPGSAYPFGFDGQNYYLNDDF
ncbi:hypothetical protein [Novosphingobium sp. BL-52-GroH]|uniref:hypothetical protein n=1 Tax=Novosphingobium sp. BL-52-GroH TaxID=3349877 RepID=UPI00384B94BB